MGIPRLTQDVSSFAESVLLGNPSSSLQSASSIKKLVIDGPSLVYHVYNQLLLLYGSRSDNSLPTYKEINAWLMQFLEDLELCGVEIVRIFFDGGLPTEKQGTRLDRLEKSRQQLENARRLQSAPPVRNVNAQDLKATKLWHSHAVTARSPFPAPPFMVPSAIEQLQKSRWRDVVTIVSGEADAYCALVAAKSGASILSNDSDLLLYELEDNAIIGSHSLQLDASTISCPLLRGLCLRPKRIADQLRISNMLEYGFERYMDVSATQSIIVERTRKAVRSQERLQLLERFRQGYKTHHLQVDKATMPVSLDPRIAEMITRLHDGESLRNYLPVLIEDHDKDSSWSYGTSARRLAYSILTFSNRSNSTTKAQPTIVEFARRGARIAESRIQCLTAAEVIHGLNEFLGLLNRYLVSTATQFNNTPSANLHLLLAYYLLASHIVIKHRTENGKAYAIPLRRIFNHNILSHPAYSWDDMHILANIHAVLYSIRILKQVMGYVIQAHQPSAKDTSDIVHLLKALESTSERLQDMPSIEDLFIDPIELHRQLSHLPSGVVDKGLDRMMNNLGISSISTRIAPTPLHQRSTTIPSTAPNTQTSKNWHNVVQHKAKSNQNHTTRSNQNPSQTQPRSQQRNPKQSSVTKLNQKQKDNRSIQTPSWKAENNPFALLDPDT